MKEIKLKKGQELFIIGDIHEHKSQFDKMIEKIKPSHERILVSVGDIYDRGEGPQAAEYISKRIKAIQDSGFGYIVRGNHEQKLKNKNKKLSEIENWAINLPLTLKFSFYNQSSLLVLHGGITPKHTWADLENNTDLLYVRKIDEEGRKIPLIKVKEDGKTKYVPKRPGKTWHKYYDGRFGYIVAGHDPRDNGKVKFYNYSCNLDTGCFKTGILSAVVFDEWGAKDIIQIKGKALYVE